MSGKYANQPVRGGAAARQRATALCKRAPKSGKVLEIGTMTGNMAIEAKALRPDLRWTMVDSWLPQAQQPQRYIDTKDDNALKNSQLCANHRMQAYQRAAEREFSILNMSSLEAAALVKDQSYDLVFIDADHSYEGVNEDIRAWRSKVKPGGWIGGHDYGNIDPRFGGVDRAVDEYYPGGVEKDQNYTWWARIGG